MDVLKIFEELQNLLLDEIVKNTKAQEEAQEEANSHDGAKVSRYDTFKEEAQYLVDGFKKKILDLNHDLVLLKEFLIKLDLNLKQNQVVRLGNVVTTKDEKNVLRHYLYSPSAGGKKIHYDDLIILVVTPISPFGKVLLGKQVNEEINLSIKQKIILIQ